jgi:BlaI family penicillinase repressor
MEIIMTLPRLSTLEMRIMEILWAGGDLSVREIQEKFPAKNRPAYTTIQTMVQRLEAKNAVRRVKKISSAFIFAAAIPRDAARRRLIDEFLAVFGGESQPIMTHLIEAGKLTLEDVQEAEKHIREFSKKRDMKKGRTS